MTISGYFLPLIFLALFFQFREEVQLKRLGEFRRSTEGEVDVRAQHFRDVRTRDVHALRESRLIKPELLHPAKDLPKKH